MPPAAAAEEEAWPPVAPGRPLPLLVDRLATATPPPPTLTVFAPLVSLSTTGVDDAEDAVADIASAVA